MSRVSIRKVFVTGLVVAVAGAVVLALSIQEGAATTSHRYQAGLLLAGIGGAITVLSWIMALVGSALLARWVWFVVVLILGVIGLLLPVMVVYSVIGPTRRRSERTVADAPPDEPETGGRRRLTTT